MYKLLQAEVFNYNLLKTEDCFHSVHTQCLHRDSFSNFNKSWKTIVTARLGW